MVELTIVTATGCKNSNVEIFETDRASQQIIKNLKKNGEQ